MRRFRLKLFCLLAAILACGPALAQSRSAPAPASDLQFPAEPSAFSSIDRPLLVLLGQLDTETPADECAAKLGAARAAGAPLEWHVYPQATHCWDCSNLDGFSKTDVRGNSVTYRYGMEDTADSRQRMFEFLDRAMGSRP